MKIIILFFVVFSFIANKIHSQDFICQTPSPEGVPLEIAIIPPLENFNFENWEWVDIGIAFHIVRKSNGDDGLDISLINAILNRLNNAFYMAKIRFFSHTIKFIDSDHFYYNTINDESEDILCSSYNVPNVINVYFGSRFPNKSTFTEDIMRKLRDRGLSMRYHQGILIKNSNANNSTIVHEFGHYFNLFHTFEEVWGMDCPETGDCYSQGDLICDTYPEPAKHGGNNFNNNCNYIGEDRASKFPCTGQYYDIPGLNFVNAKNFMSYAPPNCRITFTGQQMQRIRYTLEQKMRDELLRKWVKFENRLNNENIGGNFLINNIHSIKSGKYFGFKGDTRNSVKTNERISGAKHNNWNGNKADYKLIHYFNVPTTFTKSEQIANFLILKYAIIKNRFEGFEECNMGTISFQDPLYVLSDGSQPGNHWINATGCYEPTGSALAQEKGVFLDQKPDPNNPNQPYYSVKVSPVQDIELPHTGRVHSFHFQGWSASPQGSAEFQNANALETPVVFKQEGATVSANYKGTQLSNDKKAFSNNSQRKFVRSNYNRMLHVVYESMGKIWYETSTDNGVTWQLRNGGKPLNYGIAKNPSITCIGAKRSNPFLIQHSKIIIQQSEIL